MICNSSNVQVPTTVCIDSVGAILTNLGTIDLTSQEEILIILRRLYVRMVRIINDSIILLNGQYEIPLIFTNEFAKIQILRTILISNVNFKRRVNLKCIRLKPTEFNIEEIFNNTRDNLFEMIKKNNKGILLYNIKDIKLQIQQNIQIQLKDLHKMLNKKIYNIITSDEININKKMLFEALVLRDDIADCEKHKQNTRKFLK